MTSIESVRRFRQKKILVLGDALLDTYIETESSRLCREAPVPLLNKVAEIHIPGGAANCAANVSALGAEVVFLSIVGSDRAADLLKQELHTLDTLEFITSQQQTTPHKCRILTEHHYVARLDEGAVRGHIYEETCYQELLARLEKWYSWCDALIVSDYCYGVLAPHIIEALCQLQSKHAKPLILDSQDLLRFRQLPTTVITPNETEARMTAYGFGCVSDDIWQIATTLQQHMEAETILITRAEKGAVLLKRDGTQAQIPTHPVSQPHDVGAGDTFAATLTLALTAHLSLEEATGIACEAANIAVSRPRTAVVTHQELLQRISLRASRNTTPDEETLLALLEAQRQQGKRIVLTSGVFDILNVGHLYFLRTARQYGDVLVVGVNSEQSVQELKGPRKPINSASDRLALVAALGLVDYALLFNEPTAHALLEKIRPTIYIKGGDHSDLPAIEVQAAEAVNAQVVLIPLLGEAGEPEQSA
ncbi:D-beta-D-heptose 7-phosphate kinase/D-beta-D-heptose 1-phosphate adenosyltransferase [Thermosporothrix hazakensis]|uniref:D-beta-D-heptose 7-phosphate kinase/D-beta-D-heptose 1-phosphate adenosyltransferase n=2 Tax=Thermosporothrix TaxID=768650 RepID=A0A326UK90_THEHA|nr:PfkB family carbohydrate kinase [Thermosporothrix hazakensis]PZW29377.1 D-beta-D-heptose 7-phosphate kinase/D-beta-D-heptose 1-phosphate adenosyltransferase [Thermosporothrix hazakensis]BBH85662.1 bifunctional protein HldE [Thermosporothrix sp. COM3]GCE45909.1 bifunctional protein HldE [Thermosporothrix hazakensis]